MLRSNAVRNALSPRIPLGTRAKSLLRNGSRPVLGDLSPATFLGLVARRANLEQQFDMMGFEDMLPCDIVETSTKYVATIEMPGAHLHEISISLDEDAHSAHVAYRKAATNLESESSEANHETHLDTSPKAKAVSPDSSSSLTSPKASEGKEANAAKDSSSNGKEATSNGKEATQESSVKQGMEVKRTKKVKATMDHPAEDLIWLHAERSWGNVERTLFVPPDADFASAKGNLADGLLTLSFTKGAPHKHSRRMLELQ